MKMLKSCFLTNTITLLLIAISSTFADDDAKYVCEIAGSVKPCDDNANYKVVCDLQMKNNGDHVVLEGKITINDELGDGDEIKIDIVKEQDNGVSDPVFTVVTSVCEAMQDKETPWYIIFETMGLDGCPVKSGEYKIEDMRFDLDSMSGFMNHEYVGEYGCQLCTTSRGDTTSCHKLTVAIMEQEE